jgi:hypothetical protein
MKRTLRIVLADAFDRAAHDVFVAPQVHAACNDPAPTSRDCWAYWCQGFTAGLLGDYVSMPLNDRFGRWARAKLNRLLESVRGAGTGGGES